MVEKQLEYLSEHEFLNDKDIQILIMNSEDKHDKLDRHNIKEHDTCMYFFIYEVAHWVEHFDEIVKRSFQVEEKLYIAKALHRYIHEEMHNKSTEVKSFSQIETLLLE